MRKKNIIGLIKLSLVGVFLVLFIQLIHYILIKDRASQQYELWLSSTQSGRISKLIPSEYQNYVTRLKDKIVNSENGNSTTFKMYDNNNLTQSNNTKFSQNEHGANQVYPTNSYRFIPLPYTVDSLKGDINLLFVRFAENVNVPFDNNKIEKIKTRKMSVFFDTLVHRQERKNNLSIKSIYIVDTTYGAMVEYPSPCYAKNKEFNPKSRLWFSSGINEEIARGNYVLLSGDGTICITSAYQDYQSEIGLVRTYVIKFTYQGVAYLLCMDLLWEKPSILKEGLFTTFISTFDWQLVYVIFCVYFFVISYILISKSRRKKEFQVKLVEGKYEEGEFLSFITSESKTRQVQLKVPFKGSEAINGVVSSSKKVSENYYKVDLERIRGIEDWTLKFGSSRNNILGVTFSLWLFPYKRTVIIKYTESVDPIERNIIYYKGNKIDLDFKSEYPLLHQQVINAILSCNKNIQGIKNPCAKHSSEKRILQQRTIQEFQEVKKIINNVNKQRFYFNDGLLLDHSIYADARVKAICHFEFLKKLIDQDQLSFLEQGHAIERLFIYDDEEQWNKLIEVNKDRLVNHKNTFERFKAININTQDESIAKYITRIKNLDFSVLNEEFVVVSQDNYETERIEGFVSWRESDVQFFIQVYDKLEKLKAEKIKM